MTDHVFPSEKRGLSPIPVVVLTGALGAGKTTLLNAALRGGAIRNTALIVNEFGAVGIDNELIESQLTESSGEEVMLLPGGCACCEVRADLAEAMLRLERSALRGWIPAFERIVVETSGLAEPGPILQLCIESPALAARFRLEALVAVVDAGFGLAALAQEGTDYRQALLADRLLVTKWEGLPRDVLDLLDARLAAINPHAELFRAQWGGADTAWFGPAQLSSPRTLAAVAPEFLRAAHDESIESFVLRWEDAHPLAAIGEWLHELAEGYGERLLRVKGIVATAGDPRPVAVHAIRHLVAAPEFLRGQARASRVVFIVRGLEPGDVRPAWSVAVESASQRPTPPGLPRPGWTAAYR